MNGGTQADGFEAESGVGVVVHPGRGSQETGSGSNVREHADVTGTDRCIHELFEDQVRGSPDSVALICRGQSLSYLELSRRANQVARTLRRAGVGPDRLVGLYFDRSPGMLIALLGVLKAGGAYVALDPAYPEERLEFVLRDSSPQLVLTDRPGKWRLPRCEVIVMDEARTAFVGERDEDLAVSEIGLNARHLAYVVYTSGSTGEPKGVAAEHRSMVNRIAAQAVIAPFVDDDICCQKTSIGFVDAVFETLGPLCYGRPLVLVPHSLATDPVSLARTIRSERVTRLISVPSLAKALLGSDDAISFLQGIRAWTLSGEELRGELLAALRLALPRCQFLNLYGSSEVAADCTYYPADSSESGRVPIGKPIHNTRVYVLDENLHRVPDGEMGEIYVAGAGLARGYLNRPQLTAERFVTDPFASDPQERMYRTGDLGRLRPDGLIEYLGRRDQQIKIRGIRIEPGEIEAQLVRHGEVKEAVVAALEDAAAEKRLVAYVIPMDHAHVPRAESLREHLKRILPDYMVPSAFVAMETFPLTATGKLDRQALPAPDASSYIARDFEAPQGEKEQALAAIWTDLLQWERVGRKDHFFELGGNSLLIMQMLDRLRRAGLSAEVSKVFENRSLADLAATLTRNTGGTEPPPNGIPIDCEHITPAMLPLVQLEAEHIAAIVATVPGGAANVQDIYPLAPLQQGLLFHHLLDQMSDTYVISTLLCAASRNHLEQLVAALQWAMDRHDMLRTAVLWENLPQPVQVVHREATLPVEQITLDHDKDPLRELKERMKPGSCRLDLRRAPLLRLTIASDPHSFKWYVLLQTHHLVCDEESLEGLLREVTGFLAANVEHLPKPLPYRDHVFQGLSIERQQAAKSFFRTRLGEVEQPTAPFGILEARLDGSAIDEARGKLASDLAERLRLVARKLGVSPAILFHAAWALVVSRTAAQDDVTFGTVFLGRMQSRQGSEQSLGMFINTLPLRLRLKGLSADGIVRQTQIELAELLDHEQASLAEAQRESGVAASLPLFTSLLNYRHSGSKTEARWASTGLEVLFTVERTNYPIAISIDELEEGFSITAQTDRRIEPHRTIAYLETAVTSLVHAMENHPEAPALLLEVVPKVEQQQILESFNATQAPYPRERLIHELFEEQAARTPDAVAVEWEGQYVTYAQLNENANVLACHLQAQGVTLGECVPIVMSRSLQMVIAELAVLKCGGAYVPIEPGMPEERMAFLIRDCQARRILTDGSLRGDRLGIECIDCKSIETFCHGVASQPQKSAAQALSAAYVMYTSGSTGSPKGVIVHHRAVIRLVINNEYVRIDASDCIAHCSNPAFDASTFEIWGSLLNGARLVIVPQPTVLDAVVLAALLIERRVTILWLTVGLFNQYEDALADVFGRLRCLLTGGDVVDPQRMRRVLRSNPPGCLMNAYGPTECTTFTTTFRVKEVPEGTKAVPIGKPISNTTVYILGGSRQIVPIGAIGEIYVGGDGVALGYLNRSDLTADRFLPDPFSSDPNARMYRTGDLGRWRSDGTIEFMGRNDEQVKIRGFRIELGEIELQLLTHPQVEASVVVARAEEDGEKKLIAYVISRDPALSPDGETLRRHLKDRLPEYMMPSTFVVLEAFPLTPNGKVDRRALPAPDVLAYAKGEYEAPEGAAEEILVGIWQELLHATRVGRTDNFFELGGHSLLIVQMMERLRRVGLACEIRQIFEAPTLAALARALTGETVAEPEVPPNRIPTECDAITPEMLPLVELEPLHIERIVQTVPGGATNIQDIYPLTPLQEGLLFHHLLSQGGADLYVGGTLLSISSRERLEELIAALQWAVDRHDMLRTAVLWEGLPNAVQVVYRQATLPVDEVVFDRERDLGDQLREWMSSEQQRMDLVRAPLMRLRVAADHCSGRWYALLRSHHIVSDNTSQAAVMSQVVGRLQGYRQELPLPVPYRNHVAHVMAYARANDARAFFRRKLADVNESTAPFGLLEVHGDGTNVAEAREDIQPGLASRLRVQARRLGVSAATLFHTAWALVVARTTGKVDVVFGTVLLGRLQSSAGARRMLGLFINTLPLRIPLADLGVKALVERTQRELVELLGHEQASLASAQRCSGIVGTAPLFTTLLNFRHDVPGADAQWGTADGIEVLGGYERTNYPIAISVDDLGEGFNISAETDTRIAATRVLAYLRTAISSLVDALESSPATPALSLEVLPEAERTQLLDTFNATERPYPKDKLIHELFEQQVARVPESIAVVHEAQSLTYAELNARANQLAWYLSAKGVKPDQPVGICVERSLETVVGILGILKAGGAYLPLDPSYPSERLEFMLKDAGPAIVLTQERLRRRLPSAAAEVIVLDRHDQRRRIRSGSTGNLVPQALGLRPDHMAYVIYTSGSTGKPKGVMVEHRSLVNHNTYAREWYGVSASDAQLLFSSMSFDLFVEEVFTILCAGARLVVAGKEEMVSIEGFGKLVSKHGITLVNVPTAFFHHLCAAQISWSGVRVVVVGGEELGYAISRQFKLRHPEIDLLNTYGPTETTIISSATRVTAELLDTFRCVPIGRPIANTKCYILGAQGNLQPLGVSGELYIGGDGVARGYLNRAELTRERFLPNPFVLSERMYRTGDLARWSADGSLEYLGRIDTQVKIRGFRIELGEIEAQLAAHPGIREAVVTALAEESGSAEKRLVGYVIPVDQEVPPTAEALREYLKDVLPEYMVPGAFVMLEDFPLTPNGKLDRRRLPAPDASAYAIRPYEPPQGDIEEVLAGIWQELLHVERVGRSDNFFELGGHSLLIVQMMERLRQVRLSCEIRQVFESPTLSALAGAMKHAVTAELHVPPNEIPPACEEITPEMLPLIKLEPRHIARIVQAVTGGVPNIQDVYGLVPLQEGILFHHLLDQEGGDTYISPILLSVESRERLQELIVAMQTVIDRHDVLRTGILWEGLPRAVQVVYRRATLSVEEVVFDGCCDTQGQLNEWMAPERQRMDLQCGPLIRLKVAADPRSERWYALIQLHHIISDHGTLEVIVSEVHACLNGSARSLPPVVPYRNHVAQALAYASTHDSQAFFRAKLGTVDESTAPFGLLDVRGVGSQVDEISEELSDELAGRLRAQGRILGVSTATLIHAAWALVVARTSSRKDVVYGTVLLGRLQSSPGSQRMLGLFINTLPLRIHLAGVSAQTLVELTQRELVELLNHEQASLAEAQRCSGMNGIAPLFTTLLNYRHSVPNPEGQWNAIDGVEELAVQERTNYPITVSVDDLGDGFTLTVQTDRRIAPKRIVGYLKTTIASLVTALEHTPERAALSLEVLPESERRQVIEEFNAGERYFDDKPIQELFEEQALMRPDHVAVVCEGESLTYGQLNAKANQLAWFLRSRGVKPNQLVGICMERGLEMVVGLLGIVKAGAGYLPLDPGYPPERLAYMVDDAAPAIVLIQERLRDCVPALPNVVALDNDGPSIDEQPTCNTGLWPRDCTSSQVAYVIYTSGSTGRPKGVMVEHRNVVRLFSATKAWFDFSEHDVWTLFHSFGFDFSVWELWGALLHGGRVVVVPYQTARSPKEFYQLLCRERVTVLNQTPSAFAQLIDAQGEMPTLRHALRVVVFGGEALEFRTLRPWVGRNGVDRPQLVNMYGITETTVHVTYRRLSEEEILSESGSIIGKPIPDLRTYLLNDQAEPVPIGVKGEIYVGGAGVTRGYLNRPELTKERFVPDFFSADSEARMYKTGDLGRWRDDGAIEYLGRDDEQVKIRGFRIELGEIAAQLVRHPDVNEAVVVAREDAPGEKRLVGYVIPKDFSSFAGAESLRAHLAAVVPDYMVPGAFVTLETLPLTANGKLDRRALPAPDLSSYARCEYERPLGQLEEILAGIWQELLRVQRIGRRDNFFELGGHSLLGMRLVNAARQQFEVALPVAAIFKYPTIEQMGNAIAMLRHSAETGSELEFEEGSMALPGEVTQLLSPLPGMSSNSTLSDRE